MILLIRESHRNPTNLKLDLVAEPTVIKYLHQRAGHVEDRPDESRIHLDLRYSIEIEADHRQARAKLKEHDRPEFFVHHFAESAS